MQHLESSKRRATKQLLLNFVLQNTGYKFATFSTADDIGDADYLVYGEGEEEAGVEDPEGEEEEDEEEAEAKEEDGEGERREKGRELFHEDSEWDVATTESDKSDEGDEYREEYYREEEDEEEAALSSTISTAEKLEEHEADLEEADHVFSEIPAEVRINLSFYVVLPVELLFLTTFVIH